jgi:membrane-associated phospholipid phosphatase
MSADSERPGAASPASDFARAREAAASLGARLRRNFEASRTFFARRRDGRFPIQPYDAFQIANALALAASVFALLAILLDPYLVLWRTALPMPLRTFFSFFTDFGKADWILIATGLSVIIAFVTDVTHLRPRFRVSHAIRVTAAAYVFVAVALSGIIASLGKHVIGRARPKLFADNGSFAFDFWAWDSDWAALPSGHATTGMAFGVALALLFPRLRWLFLCLGFWIVASRGFVGAHYPSDMFAGALLGALTAWLLARALARYRLIFGFDGAGYLVRRKGASGRLTRD